VGSKKDLQDFYAWIESFNISFSDVIDAIYPFEKAQEALDRVWEGSHFGKVVIKVA
jgi:NADPH:quinone reductase-like Zn-dependent oxidoreductase